MSHKAPSALEAKSYKETLSRFLQSAPSFKTPNEAATALVQKLVKTCGIEQATKIISSAYESSPHLSGLYSEAAKVFFNLEKPEETLAEKKTSYKKCLELLERDLKEGRINLQNEKLISFYCKRLLDLNRFSEAVKISKLFLCKKEGERKKVRAYAVSRAIRIF